ncbi:phage tail protein [Streptomyces bambusae]|uniref:Phage tail protein n=1 Tax=Streptomyces bambusae TaxID=1550616 RepID=A0ABS6ZCY9_9ACTN|nr:phage tail protein [Streptomyces bambusae]
MVPGLPTRHPLGAQLPAVYAEDDLAQRITESLDEVLAPVLAVLDCLPAYFDPRLAPADFAALLAGWVGAEPPADGGPAAGRAVAGAVSAHRLRGTRAGLAELVRQAFGTTPEIEESGGAVWSTTPNTPLPGSDRPHLVVRLRVADPARVDTAALSALVARARPVHLPFRVEVLPL